MAAATRGALVCLSQRMRALAAGLIVTAALVLAGPALAARGRSAPHPPAAKPRSASGTLYIRGGGYGHGVGMSQYGAYGFALHGWDYRHILAHYYTGTTIGQANPAQVVRVLLGSRSAAFAGATRVGTKALDPSITYSVKPLANGQLALINQSTRKRIGKFTAPLTATGAGALSLAGLGAYRGSLEFRPNGTGGVYTVNVIGLDDYVRGVIAAEMPSGWAPEALEAQAIAARTYAITSDVAGTFYNLYSDSRSQMYRGVSAETPATDAAVAATAGQIVTYQGLPAITYFFSSSGGHTENVEDVWPATTPSPWLRGVDDPYDGAGGNPYHRWTRRFSLRAAARRLGRLVKGKLVRIQVVQRGASPRIISAVVIGTAGATTVSGAQLQRALGLLSTWASFSVVSGPAGGAPSTGGVHAAGGHAASEEAVIAQIKRARALAAQGTPLPAGSAGQ